ncbi:CBS domain-containing protein [Magnetospirillum sulfuroxidans]|jgi:CBS domain-containing protein|uniref:CBS domain-containing protein n=1 Tax=Magnetospirillum sulfuroxidans TaxID=611300 RepID=A0ABS5ICB1_9PROT|nr:CBS domain-containing protein [Magnetospirillum sulfuroxidans]MBR9972065.1 CBS domain-containing protein [Magnetospirillum sulfuroxidans]
MSSRLIRDVIKNQSVVALPHTATVRQAAQEMAKRRIGAVVIVDEGTLSGIFTERDGLFRVLAEGLDPDTTTLDQVMSSKLSTIAPDRPLLHALHIMHDHGFRHMPVVQGGKPVGMLSIRDALDYELVHFVKEIEKKEALTEIIR